MKKLTVSHKMLFTILIVYVLIAIVGIFSIKYTLEREQYEAASQIAIALFSYTGVCGTSTIVVYANKASKENTLEISIHKYEIRLKLAKEIYQDIAFGKIDDKSIALVKLLIEDNSNDNNPIFSEQTATNFQIDTLKDTLG